MAKGEGAGKAGRAGKEADDEKKKRKNPVIIEARRQFVKDLKAQGTSDDQVREKVRSHMKDTVRPAMVEAKKAAVEKKLKGPDRDKFIADSIRSKLGIQQKA